MSKKTLLQEASVRKFMKLANLNSTLSANFITEQYGEDLDEQAEEDVELDMADEAPMGDMDDEAPMDDMDDEAPMDDAAAVEVSEEEALALVDAIAMAIQDVTGHSIVAQGDAPEDMGPMDPMDAAPPADDFVPVEDEEALAEIQVIDEEEVMNETWRRVAARLSTMNKEEKLVERIVKKLEKRLVTTKK